MKIFALADPHGNMRLLKEVLKEVDEGGYDVFLGLGDFMSKKFFSKLVTSLDVEKKSFIPGHMRHPIIRIRKKGDIYMMTKKEPENGDSSTQKEYTIPLTEGEFRALKEIDGKNLVKVRYYKKYKDRTAEIDVFKGDLEGLVLVDFEFESQNEKESFNPPDFCLADVTQEEFIAGGMLCGKSYEDIENELDEWNYKPIKNEA